MKKRLLALLFAILFLPGSATADTLMLWRLDWLQQVKAQIGANPSEANVALDAVIRDADRALSRGPYSVTDKTGFPANRDIHDYYSLAPYWWPDPDKSNGLPYIRRDGRTNPQRYGDGVDGNRRHDMVEDVTALTLAGYFTGERRYLDHAARQIRTWFLDPRTLMNPNMEHSQYIPGRSGGRSIGIIDSRSFVRIIDVSRLLHEAGALSDQELAELRAWFGRFADWLLNSDHGKKERRAQNNHGTFYDLQLAAFSWFSGDDATALAVTRSFLVDRLPGQIEKDGRMPHELARTRPFHYTLFNLQAIMNMALFADRMGLDLLATDRQDADRIRAAISFIAGQDSGHDWPLDRTHASYEPLYEMMRLYDQMAGIDAFDALAQTSGNAFAASRIMLLIPAPTPR